MADGVTVAPLKPRQRKSKQNPPPAPTNSRSHFLFRALIAFFFFFIFIPILPSIAPDFFSQNLFSQSWELLHIVFVGIAVSYGLFSRRYDDSGGELAPKSDSSTQSYVSRLLQVSSVFDDDEDVDSPAGSASSLDDDGGNKVQTWSSQYFRNEPVVVVANKKQTSVIRDDDDDDGHKPLLLPVRSLKSRVSDENGGGGGDSTVSGRSYTRSRSYSSSSAHKEPPLNWEKKIRNGSLKSRVSDFSGFSGSDPNSGPDDGAPNSISEEGSVVLPSPIPWRSRSGMMEKKKEDDPPMESQLNSKSPPIKAFPAPACLFESQSKRSEDSGRKKAVYRPSTPPPPPPPPPMALYNKPSLVKSKAIMSDHGNEASSWEDSRSRSSSGFWIERKELIAGERAKERSKVDYSSSGKSCRTIRSARTWKEADEEGEEVEEEEEEPSLTRDGKSSFSDYTNEGEHDFLGEVHSMSDDDDDEDEADEPNPENGKEESAAAGGVCSSSGVDDEGPDVDKKADEFIAKFREQIRLQRIESIKRSTGQLSRSSVR